MNLLYAEIIEVIVEDGMRLGRSRVGGAMKKFPLDLLTDPKCGDTVLLCDGVAISKVQPTVKTENNDVPRNPR